MCWERTAAASSLRGAGSAQRERGEAGESPHVATELRGLFQLPHFLHSDLPRGCGAGGEEVGEERKAHSPFE